MRRGVSILVGSSLILVGILMLFPALLAPLLGLNLWLWGAWRLWPVLVVSLGLTFMLPPLLTRRRPGLGILFIFGMPILTTGAILLLASLFTAWSIWRWLWPLEVLALALGFLFAAIRTRVIWLLIPVILIGFNGAVLQFCALTGLWETWAVLWTVEPFSLGISFLLISARRRSSGLFLTGVILCALAGLGLLGMTTFLSGWWLISLVGPALLILTGLALILWGILRRPAPVPAME